MAGSQYIPYVSKNPSCFKNITGQRYGRLVAAEPLRKIGRDGAHWRCVCDCGAEIVVPIADLTTGNTQSCGCYMRDMTSQANGTHHMSKTKTYVAWAEMRKRCNDPRNAAYKYYGARGISHDPRWEKFENFLADMGESPPKLQLDRIDNNGNYCKANCHWVTQKVNANNKRTTIHVQYRGEDITLAALSQNTGIKYIVLYKRLRAGWSVEKAVNTPNRLGG